MELEKHIGGNIQKPRLHRRLTNIERRRHPFRFRRF
jgi:hypothetical protein